MDQIQPTTYEQERLDEIETFKNPKEGWLDSILSFGDVPVDRTGEAIFNSPAGEHLTAAMNTVLGSLNDVSRWSVRREAILEDFQGAGHELESLDAIQELELEEVDEVLKRIDLKYKFLALVEGSLSGVAGVVGAFASVPALMTLALRAINEYALYYGFDVESSADEQAFALAVLGVSGATTDTSRKEMLVGLTRLSEQMNIPAEESVAASQMLVARNARIIAESLLMSVAKSRFARSVPLAGALIGSGFSRALIGQVCKTSQHIYRERFLLRKYGAAMAPVAVEDIPVELLEQGVDDEPEAQLA